MSTKWIYLEYCLYCISLSYHMVQGCGTTNHTNSQCSTICSAWGKQCLNCNKQNHFAKVCRQTTPSQGTMNALIAHLRYDNTSDTYTTMNNDNITEIPALLSLHERHKHKWSVTLLIFPDSGASLCHAGLKLLQALGVTKENLIPCNKIVTTVGGSKISYLGWLPITFKIHDHTTTQPVYICDKVDKMYFSRKGCLETNIFPALLPFPMPSKEQESVQSVTVDTSVPNHQDMSQIVSQNGSKSTHALQPPPEKPAPLPYPATNENVPKLKQYKW